MMTVGIGKAVLIHESMIFRFGVCRTTCSHSSGDKLLDLLAAFAGETYQYFGVPGGITDGFWGEFRELGMGEKHDNNCLADDDSLGIFIGELRVVLIAKRVEEGE